MPARKQSPAIALRFEGVTILVVEDHEDSRDAMRQFLESIGATVLLARNAREGFDLLTSQAPDVTLCDLRMPSVDGYMLVERVKADPRVARAKIIAVSAFGEPTDVQRTWAAGFDGHLVKPVDHELLVATLQRTLWARFPTESRPRRRERRKR
jgi:CheY-like chemotaxis protein